PGAQHDVHHVGDGQKPDERPDDHEGVADTTLDSVEQPRTGMRSTRLEELVDEVSLGGALPPIVPTGHGPLLGSLTNTGPSRALSVHWPRRGCRVPASRGTHRPGSRPPAVPRS